MGGDEAAGSPVTHPADTATLVEATRALLSTLRTADAPVGTLRRASALVQEATELLAPHRVDGVRAQTGLRVTELSGRTFESRDIARLFPYSPVVGPLNAMAPPLTFAFNGERLRGRATLSATYAGPPGAVHGGIVAMVLDELLGDLTVFHGVGGPTGTLTVRYERPTPIETELEIEGWVERVEGRKVFAAGTISAAGQVTARAEGVFIRAQT